MTLPTHLLWLDLETTGLATECDVLEVAAAIAPFDRPFEPTSSSNVVVGYRDWSRVDDAVIEMHARSGLVADCCRSRWSLADAEKTVLLLTSKSAKGSVLLAGSTVGPFDKRFVDRHMPTLAAMLHHRVYDVSAVRNFCYSLGMPEQAPIERERDLRRDFDLVRPGTARPKSRRKR